MNINIIERERGVIEYSDIGSGIPILFLHGGHSNCRETLNHKGFDTNKYQLITPSRPGYGNTPLSDKVTPARTADLIISLLDHLKIDRVILYAISAGGLSSIAMAARYPERVEKLILASAVAKNWLDKKERVYKTAKKIFNPKAEVLVWGLIRFFSGIFPGMIARSFYPQFSTVKSHRLEKADSKELLMTFKHYNSKSGFLNDIDQELEEGMISKIQCPTLVIHSNNDSSVPFEHAEYANKMILNSKLISLNNEWGHLLWIGNDSNDSINRIMEFIEQ